MPPSGLVISRIGPNRMSCSAICSGTIVMTCRSGSTSIQESTEVIAMTRPRFGLKAAGRIWPKSALQSQASLLLDQAPNGWATLALTTFTNFLSCAGFDGMASAKRWLLFFGVNIRENGSSECPKPTRQLSSSGGPQFRITPWVHIKRRSASSTNVPGDSFGSCPMA